MYLTVKPTDRVTPGVALNASGCVCAAGAGEPVLPEVVPVGIGEMPALPDAAPPGYCLREEDVYEIYPDVNVCVCEANSPTAGLPDRVDPDVLVIVLGQVQLFCADCPTVAVHPAAEVLSEPEIFVTRNP